MSSTLAARAVADGMSMSGLSARVWITQQLAYEALYSNSPPAKIAYT